MDPDNGLLESDFEDPCTWCSVLIEPGDLIASTPDGYVHAGRCL